MECWENVYLADWNSQILTHTSPTVIGRVMREGDTLNVLQNAMLSADNGVYNIGIIISPASGEFIVSMYVPIFDGTTPIGYVGGGVFVNQLVGQVVNIESIDCLDFKSAYAYFADNTGIILCHPDPEKIGNPIENVVVKDVVAKLEAGNHPCPECIEYDYKGIKKYAVYYVGENEWN